MNFPQNVKYTNEHEWIRLEVDCSNFQGAKKILLSFSCHE